MTLTEILADICLAEDAENISDNAYRAAEKLLLDSLGCAMAAHDAPGIQAVTDQVIEWGGKNEASLFLSSETAPAPNAAFVNSAMIHALDYDDVHIPGLIHITSIVVPAMLATGEMAGASGKNALAAMITGIEVAARLAMAETRRRRSAGFLPSSLAGGFGGVATAARLLGLNREQTVNALGINYAQAAGNRQALLDLTLTKRLQPAFAVRSAIWSVALARRGVTGPEKSLEGEAGYFKLFMNGEIPAAEEFLTDREQKEVERVALKRYPSCGGCHHVQIAAERLAVREKLGPEKIARVELFGCGPGGLVGNPFRLGSNPQVAAQFSAAWAAAFALLRGKAKLADYTNRAVTEDKQVVDLAGRITYTAVPDDVPRASEMPADYPKGHDSPHGLILHTTDGRRLTACQYPFETFAPGNMSFEETVEKFKDCAEFSGICATAKAMDIVNLVSGFCAEENVKRISNTLAGEALPQSGN